MDLCHYVVWFGLFSVIGWLYECTYCAIRTKKWENRGFLFGPVCPIYGVGATTVILLFSLLSQSSSALSLTPVHVFIICAAGSAVLEYGTSYVLETFFHARWWDYSHIPFNIKGRVALPFTLCFGAAGTLLFYFVAEPAVHFSTTAAAPEWLWQAVALLAVSILSADTALTNAALSDLDSTIQSLQADFDAVMDVAVADMVSGRIPLTSESVREHAANLAQSMSGRQRRVLAKMTSFSAGTRAEASRMLRETVTRAREAASSAAEHAAEHIENVRLPRK